MALEVNQYPNASFRIKRVPRGIVGCGLQFVCVCLESAIDFFNRVGRMANVSQRFNDRRLMLDVRSLQTCIPLHFSMQRIRQWIDQHTSPRKMEKDDPLPFTRPKTDSDSDGEEEAAEDPFTNEHFESDLLDGARTTLEFGKNDEEGGWGLHGYCEVQKKGRVEPCEWRVARMKETQRYPSCRIRF